MTQPCAISCNMYFSNRVYCAALGCTTLCYVALRCQIFCAVSRCTLVYCVGPWSAMQCLRTAHLRSIVLSAVVLGCALLCGVWWCVVSGLWCVVSGVWRVFFEEWLDIHQGIASNHSTPREGTGKRVLRDVRSVWCVVRGVRFVVCGVCSVMCGVVGCSVAWCVVWCHLVW